MTVAQELKSLVGIEVKPDETAAQFALRLLKKADQLPEDDWEAMSAPAQTWVNVAIEANLNKEPIPLPEGIDEAMVEKKVSSVEVDGVEMALSKATKAKQPKYKKPLKPAKDKEGAKRGPKGQFSLSDRIKLLKDNPYRKGTRGSGWFVRYKDGSTVEDAIAAGVPRAQVRFDANRGNLRIERK